MKIFILLRQPYPHGYALTKRVHLYAKGFRENGHKTKIIIPVPVESYKNNLDNSISGIYENIPYQCTWRSTIRSTSFLKRRYHDFFGSLKAGVLLFNEKPNIVVMSSFPFIFMLYIKIFSLIVPFKLVKEKNEIDYLDRDNISVFTKKKIRLVNIIFDGFIVINNQLSNFVVSELKIKRKLIVVPILVEDFKKNKKKPIENIILYSGTYLERKDGIISIIKGFSLVKDILDDYKLVLTGVPERSPDYKRIMDIIILEKLDKSIVFTGYLPEHKLRSLLEISRILILTKPENRQNLYNFPTRMGEYLITGRPVIATKFGIIGELFSENENMYFTDFDSVSISKKIVYVINNSKEANAIGQKGREFALEYFDYLVHSKRMIDFFENL